jgi:hypothetical protein
MDARGFYEGITGVGMSQQANRVQPEIVTGHTAFRDTRCE